MRCVKVSAAACTSHTSECFCRMGTDALTYRDDVIAPAGERHRQTENVWRRRRWPSVGQAAHRAFVAMWKSCIVPVMFVCAFFMRWSTSSSGRPAYGGPAQCRCPPQSAANCNHLWGRGGVAGWPQSPSQVCGRIVGARSSDKSFGGLKLREHKLYVTITREKNPRDHRPFQ